MRTLYWFWSFNPQKARLALEELGLEYSLVTVDLASGGQHTELISRLNPNRKVPILVVNSFTLWESNAILTYLGESERRLWPMDPEGKGNAARWLNFEARQLSEPIGEMWLNGYLARVSGRTPDTLAAENASKKVARYLSVLEGHLAESEWMLGENPSLVDCCYGPVIDALALAGDYIEAYPSIKAYLGKLRSRKSWRACAFRQ
jgi:glutathione S-transferase